VLQRPALTDHEVETLRIQMIRLAQAVCEHVWQQKVY